MKPNKLALRLCLSLVSILVCLIFLEIAVSGYYLSKQLLRREPLRIVVDAPILYGLNPEHPEISSESLRDNELSIPKPSGTLRILILGDSIAYGTAVSRNNTFPNRLEALLRKQFKSAEVINAGVSRNTAYNELQYYLNDGREFEPDIVIVAFCMNDVVNPRLHWNSYTNEKIAKIPDEARPNHDYDLNHALPKIQKLKSTLNETEMSLRDYSELYKVLERRIRRLFQKKANEIVDVSKNIPTLITGEDTLSIEVLLDQNSSEWRWLTSIYDHLHRAVRSDQATLIIALFPLAYQIDKDYPFLPQIQIAEYCKQNSILCIDLLESFREHSKEDIFLLNNSGAYDIWHLTRYGHELSAAVILRFLQERKLLSIEKYGE